MMMYLRFFVILLVLCGCSGPEPLRLNHIQIIGGHNSYKDAIERPLMGLLLQQDSGTMALDYRHLPLTAQLEIGIRGFEIDAVHDPEGGRFKNPVGIRLLDSLGLPFIPFDPEGEMDAPGFKVLHVPDIDFRSHCLTFIGCLSEMKLWSQDHPDHVPIIITINPKNSGVGRPGFTEVIPFTKQVWEAFDAEIRSVFGEEELITPDQVRGDYEDLRSAVLEQGWPVLDAARGRFLFVLNAGKETIEAYLAGGMKGRPMFVDVGPDHPAASFFIMNNPEEQKEEIQALVRQGFMVRTRADAGTVEARTGDYTRFTAAQESGAHLISTDYYVQALSPNKDFEIAFDDKTYSRCNPLLKPQCEL
ncbi:MAG: phosphatidylinositol-specific phospholipase C1-like protein [Bacteroidota bacterium]